MMEQLLILINMEDLRLLMIKDPLILMFLEMLDNYYSIQLSLH